MDIWDTIKDLVFFVLAVEKLVITTPEFIDRIKAMTTRIKKSLKKLKRQMK